MGSTLTSIDDSVLDAIIADKLYGLEPYDSRIKYFCLLASVHTTNYRGYGQDHLKISNANDLQNINFVWSIT